MENKGFKVLIFSAIFLAGFLSAILLSMMFSSGYEMPFSASIGNLTSPHDFVSEENIEVYPDRVVIYVDNASLSRYAPTGSMLPLFDQGANGIRIKPSSEKDINVGDIVTFSRDSRLIVHRVAEKGVDEEGIYFVTKGDNNDFSDGKIRFSDIRYVTVGIIY